MHSHIVTHEGTHTHTGTHIHRHMVRHTHIPILPPTYTHTQTLLCLLSFCPWKLLICFLRALTLFSLRDELVSLWVQAWVLSILHCTLTTAAISSPMSPPGTLSVFHVPTCFCARAHRVENPPRLRTLCAFGFAVASLGLGTHWSGCSGC